MNIRPEVARLAALGSLPTREASVEVVGEFEEALKGVVAPLTDEEARILVRLFGPDDFYGLAWTMMHLVESAPSWPIRDCLEDRSNEWTQRLARRAQNAGLLE